MRFYQVLPIPCSLGLAALFHPRAQILIDLLDIAAFNMLLSFVVTMHAARADVYEIDMMRGAEFSKK
jgi:hypothetical protein